MVRATYTDSQAHPVLLAHSAGACAPQPPFAPPVAGKLAAVSGAAPPAQLSDHALASQLQEAPAKSLEPCTGMGMSPVWPSPVGAVPAADGSWGKQEAQQLNYVICYYMMPATVYPGTAGCGEAVQPQQPYGLPGYSGGDCGDALSGTDGEVAPMHGGDWAMEAADAGSEGSGPWAPPSMPQGGHAPWRGQASQSRRHRHHRAAGRARDFAQVSAVPGGYAEREAFAERLKAGLMAEESSEHRTWAVGVLLAEHPNIVEQLAFEPAGCRVVQDALERLDRVTASAIAAKLRGLVRRAVWSPHANHVVQKVIQCLPPQECAFIVEELSDTPVVYARHEYGCRVFCRLLEHAASDEATRKMMEVVIRQTQTLCCHRYGHYVVEHVLEHGTAEQRRDVAAELLSALAADASALLRLAWDSNAVFVLEKALLCASPHHAGAVAQHLLADPRTIVELAKVLQQQMLVRALLAAPGQLAAYVLEVLRNAADELQSNRHGRRLLERYTALCEGCPPLVAGQADAARE